ncbi:MAG: hypothetical protein PVG97_00410 [Syntrophobacterales bacterium]
MCNNHRLSCSCGQSQANLLFKNHILNPGVLSNIFCPKCSRNVDFDAQSMLADNNWILEFDLVIARGCLHRANINTPNLDPEFIFDQGYASWNGFTPDELDQRLAERQKIIGLATQDMHLYLAEIKRWGSARVKKFREAGWRKAQLC